MPNGTIPKNRTIAKTENRLGERPYEHCSGLRS